MTTRRKAQPKTVNQPKPVIVFGVRYDSISAAARAAKCSHNTIQHWLKNAKRVAGRASYAADLEKLSTGDTRKPLTD